MAQVKGVQAFENAAPGISSTRALRQARPHGEFRKKIDPLRLEMVSLADIKPGDFVGPASKMGPDGKLVAISLQLFPAALRGVVPEGRTPWDLEPG